MVKKSMSTPKWLSWLRLARVPGVFTAIADVTVGFLVADGSMERLHVWGALVLATSCLYSAGMILNDFFDRDLDATERPERPLPSGEISPPHAKAVGLALLVLGILVVFSLGSGDASVPWLRAGTFALALAASIVFYDAFAKATLLGPLVMGGCRSLNVLMGVAVTQDVATWSQYPAWTIAAGIGLYVMGITWFARDEAIESHRMHLAGGLVLMVIGFLMLMFVPRLPGFSSRVGFTSDWVWPLLLCLLSGSVWSNAIRALIKPNARAVQGTVKQGLLNIIVFDAALALLLGGPQPAIGLILLLVPASLLGRLISLT